ncbi:MAG: substrate-binding domain-containing protein, partial [bacterium]|nr:substrate-binding domain-containing protein [bacterium]
PRVTWLMLNSIVCSRISIVGYDDVPEASWKGYDLTSVSQSSKAMVAAAADIIVEQIERSAVRTRAAVIPAELAIRSTARIPPN